MALKQSRDVAAQFLRYLLRPVLRFALKHGLKLHDLVDCAKSELCDLAQEILRRSDSRITDSRISVMTGVHRRDVAHINSGEPPTSSDTNVITRIVGMWQTDKRFTTSAGTPRVLTIGRKDSEFTQLVAAVSSDTRAGAIRSELERSGTIEKRRAGVALVKGSFVPQGDPEKGFQLLERDMQGLIYAVEENLLHGPKIPNLHAYTEYDCVRDENLDEIRAWLTREGHNLHLRTREFLSKFDQEIDPDPNFSGKLVRVALGTFSVVEHKDAQ